MYILICFVVVYIFISMYGSRNFRQGGSRPSRQKKTFDNLFIIFYLILVLNLFSVILSFLRKTIILKGSSSDPGSSLGRTFSKGGGGMSNFFPCEVGINADFYRNLVIFWGGLNPHILVLWIRAC